MECKKIRLSERNITEKEKSFKRLQSDIDYLLEYASVQPRIVWETLFYAGEVITGLSHVVKHKYKL